jgi:ribosome-associated protein
MDDTTLLKIITKAAEDRRAEDIKVLDLSQVSTSLDYFVICTASAGLQINAVTQNIKEQTRQNGLHVGSIEGPSERWMLLNYGTVVVHVMTQEAREYYDLEGLWNDAKFLEIKPEA